MKRWKKISSPMMAKISKSELFKRFTLIYLTNFVYNVQLTYIIYKGVYSMGNEAKLSVGKLYHQDFSPFDEFIKAAEAKCPVPENFVLAEIQDEIQQNQQDVLRLRYTRDAEANQLYGEHFSVVMRKADLYILGFVNLTTDTAVDSSDLLPSREETKALTKEFFEAFDPEYYQKLENLWIDQHDETIEVNGREFTVSGTKYKCFIAEDDNYAWVVFGRDHQPIIFERGIHWVSGRTTEKWLHDSYLESGTLDLHPVRTKQ